MRATITISLPEEIRDELDELSKSEGLSRSDLVRQALQDYLFIRKFRRLRRQTLPYAQAQGFFTDEDIFEEIS